MRPVLRPGTHVLRRTRDEVQVGLDPRQALVLPDSADVRAALAGLRDASAAPAGPGPAGVLDLLDRHGLLVDQQVLRGRDGQPTPPVQAAQARAHGDAAEPMRQTRAGAGVRVTGFGHPAGDWLSPELARLLESAGLGCRPGADHGGASALVGVGEPDRDLLDPWVRAGTAHVLVRLTEGQATVGPFVAPGRTACLRCVDAHCTDADPAWPLLVAQYASAAARDRADGAPEPVDPLLAGLALAWAARDLATFVDGGRPSTWSATVTLDADLAAVRCRTWLRHPACGCGWG